MNKWAKIKISVFLLVAIFSFFSDSDLVGESPALFIYPILIIFMFFGSLLFFKGVSTQKKLTVGNMASFSKSMFYDPLPIFHFISVIAVISGICGIARDLIANNTIDPIALFSLSVGIGVFPGVIIANKNFIVDRKPLKKI